MTTPLVLGNKGEKGSRTTSTPLIETDLYGSPFYNTGERCQLSVFQMRTASGDLVDRRDWRGVL